jgi:uroporphyrinogen decarboxylase
MAGENRLLRVLGGEAVWPPPVWLYRQAGRYLPEYRALRAEAGSFLDLCTTPALAAEVTLQPVQRFGMDAAILFSDILILPWALGYGLEFHQGEGPVLPRLTSAAQLDALDPARLSEATAPILETVRLCRARLGDTPLIGFAGGPFTVACYMVEGGGSKDFARTRGMAYGEPALFGRLMHLLTETTIATLAAQIEAGAQAVMLFDSWAGLLSPELFDTHVREPTLRIGTALRERYPGVKLIGFPRLAGVQIARYAARSGADVVAMDTNADPLVVRQLVSEEIVLQGNLDPLALVVGGATLQRATRSVLDAMRGRRFIFNLGHGILPETAPEHVAALVSQVRDA